MSQDKNVSRRQFIKAASAVTAFSIVPRHVLGGGRHIAPSDKVNIAGIGFGGMGANNLHVLKSENIVALCDVDHRYAAKVFKGWPKAKQYKDFT